jgi:hypothetical protein
VINRTIDKIATQIQTDISESNKFRNTTIKDTILGDGNAIGLRAFSSIKLNKRLNI